MGIYLVDTNVFSEAFHTTYPMDVVEGFWSAMKGQIDAGNVISIDKVKNELYSEAGDLTKWCKQNFPDDFFKDSTTAINDFKKLAQWANTMRHHFKTSAIDEFLDATKADAWLIAYAMANDLTIVTYEVSAPQGKKRIKIPDVCHQFNVKYVKPMEMFRQLGVKF